MANFYQVFKNERICKYAKSYCEYDGDVEVVCGKCTHGKLFCYKCSDYEPKDREVLTDAENMSQVREGGRVQLMVQGVLLPELWRTV